MIKQVIISVRNLVEFVLRSGSIDSGYLSARRAVDGIKIHQKIQRKRKKELAFENIEYESEVSLKDEFIFKDLTFILDGRADGIITTAGFEAVEEIKSTARELNTIENNPEHWHWAQAKCYAYMYCRKKSLQSIKVTIIYCHLESFDSAEFESEFTIDELKQFFEDILFRYYSFANLDINRIEQRKISAGAMVFPFEKYRKSQREFAVAVYKSIIGGKRLFAQAPTGTGKTISTLFPAIKALEDSKIFYLTAKTITRAVAEEALLRMSEKGLVMRSITLTAKEKICFTKDCMCNPDSCTYADGHFYRINKAIEDIIAAERIIKRCNIEEYAEKHRVCPFEFALDVALFCDCIICDYNHVYDPKAQLKRFFADSGKHNIIVLNDEAHNLVERAREMFSAQIGLADFAGFSSMLKKQKAIKECIKKIRKWFSDIDFEGNVNIEYKPPGELLHMLRDFTVKADSWLAENRDSDGHKKLLDLYFSTLDFLRISELYDDWYVTFSERTGGNVIIKLLCLDPSHGLMQVHNKLRASVFFSATLTPMEYFRDVLGGERADYGIKVKSPFDADKLCLLVDDSVSTKYKDRQNSLNGIAERIFAMLDSRRGNYFIFFSSYAYLTGVFEVFNKRYPQINTLVQSQNMQEEEREEFLSRSSADNKETLAGFVVLGGIFSEGIDLAGDRLIGAVIIGVGLPLITAERDTVSNYYKSINGGGFEYAYMYPGMNKVMQAAGRVIRTEHDKGAVLLIDNRFTRQDYKKLFPDEWQGYKRVHGEGQIRAYLNEFWSENEGGGQ